MHCDCVSKKTWRRYPKGFYMFPQLKHDFSAITTKFNVLNLLSRLIILTPLPTIFLFISVLTMAFTGKMFLPIVTIYCGWYTFSAINAVVIWTLISKNQRDRLIFKLQRQGKHDFIATVISFVLALVVIMTCSANPVQHVMINIYISVMLFIITLNCDALLLSIMYFWFVPAYDVLIKYIH